jgi:formylglycine-generating enzyme required for sulfatase activity
MEWLWAAMGGAKGGATVTINGHAKPFAGSDGNNSIKDYAWYGNQSSGTTAGGKTHETGKKLPNELGLYDMTGNVAEWCFEAEGSTLYARHSTPDEPAKMYRGGGWSSTATQSGIAYQEETHDHPSYRFRYVGFRIARDK